jgi:hypothetical protein
MDFIIAESFFSNPDSGNKEFWRAATPGGEWRWMVFDFDWAMYPTSYRSDRLRGDLLDPAGHGLTNAFDTTLQVKLMQNPAFREKFIERYAHFLNTTFRTDRMLKVLDDSVAAVTSEMPREIARWNRPAGMKTWQSNLAALRSNFGLSQAKMKQLFPQDF